MAPNEPTRTDILAIRELMKTRLTPAFARTVDAGEMDNTGLRDWAEQQLIRQRAGEEVNDG